MELLWSTEPCSRDHLCPVLACRDSSDSTDLLWLTRVLQMFPTLEHEDLFQISAAATASSSHRHLRCAAPPRLPPRCPGICYSFSLHRQAWPRQTTNRGSLGVTHPAALPRPLPSLESAVLAAREEPCATAPCPHAPGTHGRAETSAGLGWGAAQPLHHRGAETGNIPCDLTPACTVPDKRTP